jgi:hypothetical protein
LYFVVIETSMHSLKTGIKIISCKQNTAREKNVIIAYSVVQDDINNNDLKPPSSDGWRDDIMTSEDSAFHAFARMSSRKSLTNNAAMIRWLEAQERLIDRNADVRQFTSSTKKSRLGK